MKARNKLVSFMIVLSCTLIITSHLGAATFTVGSASGSPGDKDILIPIDLSSEPGEEACSFNFDLNFGTSRLSFKEVTLGPRATEAGKSLSYRRKSRCLAGHVYPGQGLSPCPPLPIIHT